MEEIVKEEVSESKLPEDLQPELADRDSYEFPNNSRRRTPGYLYLGIAYVILVLAIVFSDSVYINSGLIVAAFLLGLFGFYSIYAGRELKIDERQALEIAVKSCGFLVGHASAQMVWYKLSSVPIWRILVYSADEPPTRRGFVVIDGTTGEVLETISEKNPERV